MTTRPILDRRVPTDFWHVHKYPLRSARRAIPIPDVVERVLNIPRQYREEYDQGSEGACVGYSQSWMMSMYNHKLYDAYRLYATAQGIDEWADTPPAAGTSLRAGFDVLRTIGHWRIYARQSRSPQREEGILENRWISSVDEARAVIAFGEPINLGINWYEQFFTPAETARIGDKLDSKRRDYWIHADWSRWGDMAGGHAITAVAASDRRQAFGLLNTWGTSYPFLVWLPYVAFERLMLEDGECGVVTDRVKHAETLFPEN